MSFEAFSPEADNERSREELQLRNEIQREILAAKFSPDEEDEMVEWVSQNGAKIATALDLLEHDHGDITYLWNTNKDAFLDALQDKMRELDRPDEEIKKAA